MKVFSYFMIFGLGSLLLTGCNWYNYCGYTPTDNTEEWVITSHEPEGIRISHAVLGLSEKWNRENHLRLQDSAYHWRGDHPCIRLDFVSQDSLEIGQARALIVDLMDDLMGALNESNYEYLDENGNRISGDNMEQFYGDHDVDCHTEDGSALSDEYYSSGSHEMNFVPIETSQIQIFINFESFHGVYIDPYYVGWISLMDNLVAYQAFNSKDNERNRWSYREEWLWQSRDFVQTTRQAKMAWDEDHKKKEDVTFEGLRYHPGESFAPSSNVRTNQRARRQVMKKA